MDELHVRHTLTSYIYLQAAWSLARELKLGKEVPVTPPPEPNDDDAQGELDLERMGGAHSNGPSSPVDFSEEQREERRRIWWLLYAVDRWVFGFPLAYYVTQH
jgi:hypothetical protein